MNLEDREIVSLYYGRNEAAIAESAKRYGKMLLGISENILKNAEDAEECVNDAYLHAWNAIPPDCPVYLGAYLSKIVRNLSLNKLREKRAGKRDAATLPFDELSECLSDNAKAPDFSEKELSEAISIFLKSEKRDARYVFLRRYFYGDTIEEIEKKTGFSASKTKSMLLRTRKKLAEYLKKEGFFL